MNENKISIQLDETYWLMADIDQWKLGFKRKDGKIEAKWFFMSLESLLKDYVELRIRTEEATSFDQLYQNLLGIIEGLNRLIEPLGVKITPLNEKNEKDVPENQDKTDD